MRVKQAAIDLTLIQMYCEPHNSRPYVTAGKQERACIGLVLDYIYSRKQSPFSDAFNAAYVPGFQDGIRRTAAVINGEERGASSIFPEITRSAIGRDRKSLSMLDDVMSDIEG